MEDREAGRAKAQWTDELRAKAGRVLAGVRSWVDRQVRAAEGGVQPGKRGAPAGSLACAHPLPLASLTASSAPAAPSAGNGAGADVPLLVSDVVVRTKNSEIVAQDVLDDARRVLRMRPGFAYTAQDIEDDVGRIFATGHFNRCEPVAERTSEGVRVTVYVEPNPVVSRVHLVGCRDLPTSVAEAALDNGICGKPFNYSKMAESLSAMTTWYENAGMFGQMAALDLDEQTGVVTVKMAEATIGRVAVRFLAHEEPAENDDAKETEQKKQSTRNQRKQRRNRAPKTKESVVARQLTMKSGMPYSLNQARRDVDHVYASGLFDDVAVLPTLTTRESDGAQVVDLTVSCVEKPSTRTFSAGGGLSSQSQTEGNLPGVVGQFSFKDNNLFGLGQRLTAGVELGQADRMYRFVHVDPWLKGDRHRTSRTVSVQTTNLPLAPTHARRTPEPTPAPAAIENGAENAENGTDVAVREPASSNAALKVKRVSANWEYGRPIAQGWYGTAGLSFQSLGVVDDATGADAAEDGYGCPLVLSASGRDQSLALQGRATYARTVPPASSRASGTLLGRALNSTVGVDELLVTVEQALPVRFALKHLKNVPGAAVVPAEGASLLQYTRAKCRVRKSVPLLPGVNLELMAKGGHTLGDLSPTEAFTVGGATCVRGYEEGGVATARSYGAATAELSFPLLTSNRVEGVLFADAGTDFGSSRLVPGMPGIVRGRPGKAQGKGFGVRLDSPLGQVLWAHAWNDRGQYRQHFSIGQGF